LFTILLLLALGSIAWLFMQQAVFGNDPSGEAKKILAQSSHYKDGLFQNIEPTQTLREGASYIKMIRDALTKPSTTQPAEALPSVQTNLKKLQAETPVLVWFGHSSYLLKSNTFTVLVDPVFSGYASPVPYFGFGKAFAGTNTYGVTDMPSIDLLILTHDHYDHLDYPTIRDLHPQVKHFVVPLGVDSHLLYWGVPAEKITTLDWWQQAAIADQVSIMATPSRHFSGRKFAQGKTLWASYALRLHGYSIFIGGDSGYDSQFKKIGEQAGPFDIALLETGQYGDEWPLIHMLPEETATAAVDLQAKVVLPVHWGKFALANHDWREPIERLLKSAEEKGVQVTTPKIGEPVFINKSYPKSYWWR
jgi:L-ascorbate metabolism protein UlaG (beta-lactamase superfamily)